MIGENVGLNLKRNILLTIIICMIITMIAGCHEENHEHDFEQTHATIEEPFDDATESDATEPSEEEIIESTPSTEPSETTVVDDDCCDDDLNFGETEGTDATEADGNEGNEDDHLVSLGEFKLTAYCSCVQCCGQWAGGTTASGSTPKANRTIAVDTSIIPFGTKVIINGNTYIAEDTGGAIKGNRIDIYFDSHQDALNFGIQYAEVFMIVE